MRILRISSLLFIVAFVALAFPTSAQATTYSQHYGVVDQWGYEIPELGQGSADIILQNLGAKWIRSVVDWDQIEAPGDNQYDPGALALMDNTVTGMSAIGVNVYYGFSYTPVWARPGGTGNNTPPTDATRYTDFINFMVNRYKNSIKYWGFWNEPNIDGFWNGTDDNYIHNILIPGIAAVKAADPTAKTVVGELASCCSESSLLQSFLSEINAHGKKDLVDVISVHGYGYGDTASGRIGHLDTLHNMIVLQGYGDKEFWCTETSWTSGSDEANQANQIITMMQAMDTRLWWKKTFYYTMGEGIWDDCGLIHPDLSPKLAYTQYQALIADRADNADVVSNTIPATMVANRQYYISVTVRNEGTATWNDQNQWKLGALGESDPFAGTRQYLNPGESVPPDALKTFWFTMTAPGTTGTYTTDWQMVHEGVRWFGHPLTKQVVVNNGPDTTPPGSVTNFTVTPADMRATLAWTNPMDADFTGVMIRYKMNTGYPTSTTDGTLVVDKANNPGTIDSYVHAGLTNGVTYYYSAFAHDPVPNYAPKVDASALVVDNEAPGSVTGFAATGQDMQIALSWTNPTDSDLAGVKIVYKTTGYPTGPTDGVALRSGPGTSCTHTGLTGGTTYYYAAYAYDEVPNYSTVATAYVARSNDYCYADSFSYADGNLNGNIGWSGSGTSEVQVVGQTVKINGGATTKDAIHAMSCSGNAGVIRACAQVKSGSGGTTLWGLWFDDAAGNNLARWYGSGITARPRIGDTGIVLDPVSLTGNWDNLELVINTVTDISAFYFNGTYLGSLSHNSTGAGGVLGRVKLERIYSSPVGDCVYLDNLTVGPTLPDSTAPGPVTSFKAYGGNGQTTLSWTNPTDVDFVGTKIMYRTSGYPLSPTDPSATVIYDAPGTSYSHTGLSNGTKYYYSAFAHDNSTNYSGAAQSSTYAAAEATIPAMKGLANSVIRVVKGNVVTAVFTGNFYMQDPVNPYGIKVSTTDTPLPSIGQKVDVVGSMTGLPGVERSLSCSGNAIRVTDPGPITITPAALNNKAVGGANLNANTPGVVDGTGANNVGLLVRVSGKVTQLQAGQYFYVDDGCGLKDGTKTSTTDNVGIRIKVSSIPSGVVAGKYVVVTGIVSPLSAGGLRPQILPRPQPAGVQVVGP